MPFWKRIAKRILLFITWPIRFSVRHEMNLLQDREWTEKNLDKALQQRAAESTVDYILERMQHVDSVEHKLELISKALTATNPGEHELILEFGVSSGATLNYIASLTNRKVFGFDSFEGLPERWRDGYPSGSFAVSEKPEVPENAELVEGWFEETLQPFLKEQAGTVAFLHIDCDVYSSTKTIFNHLKGRIQPGSVIVFDEYFNYPGWQHGEYQAFQEFISETGLGYRYIGYNYRDEQVAVKIG